MKRSIPIRIREFCNTYRKNEYALKPYLVRDGKTHPVAIICPGGGYRRVCSFIEGYPYAKKLNQMGIHAFVVFYRVRNLAVFPNPQDDLAQAVKEIFTHQEDWKLDLRGYSVWGSSAGGHLAASFGTEIIGYMKYGLPKPASLVLVYPVITMGENTHKGSKNYHIGAYASQKYMDLTSIEKNITKNYPPVYLWWGEQDQTVDPINSKMMLDALNKNHIPCECCAYPNTGHGVGIGEGLPCEGWFENAVSFWLSQRNKN